MRLSDRRGRLRVQHREEDFNPMEGVGNMADAMLVFACGLIIALILSWNVNLTDQGIEQTHDIKYNVDSIEENKETTIDNKNQLEEMGKVYRDPETGKYYVIEE